MSTGDGNYLAVRDYLVEHGWIKGDMYSDWAADTPAACLVGAFEKAYPLGAQRVSLADIIRENYGDRVADTPFPVSRFNDHPDTTWQDIEMVLEKAQAKLEESV